ncbi:hypothetical protein COY07_00995 [Candidatus Peregrinibacteria bacterium CG_4_10_14_0_2_um_filter_43_11]|nr:MAG: hypothetical protein COY07_00995 [Candidatus Peregrinibacteria bacterium CG_4_10_14_0_2_um_filter_43_11]
MQDYINQFSPYQIIVPFLALIMIMKAVSRFRRSEQTWRELITWVLVWGAVGFFALFPEISDKFANFVGIKSGANAIITAALVILFYVVFKILVMTENLEGKITKLNRSMALYRFFKKEESHFDEKEVNHNQSHD